MAKKWSEVVSSEGFMALDPEQQAQAQRQYFDTVVAPQAQEKGFDLSQVENQFFTENALMETPVEQTQEDVVLPQPPEDLTGQTETTQPIEGSNWAPIPSSETTSNWGETLQPGLGMKPGYRGDGTVNKEDPRWRGMNDYSIASKVASDERSDVWGSIPSNISDNPVYGREARQVGEEVGRGLNPSIRNNTKEKTPQEWAEFYGTADREPGIWDKADAEVLAANAPQASEQGASLLDAVYTEKAKLMAQGMSDAEAEKVAFEKAQRDSLQFAATAIPVAGLASLPARMAIAGATNTTAGLVADVAAEKTTTKSQMAEDFFWGSLGGIGGKAGKSATTKALGEGADDLKVLKDTAVQELDDLAKQAKAKESISASTSSTKPMSEALEGTKSITATDMVDAKNVATTLETLNKAGAKTSVTDILKTVKNDELRDILKRAAPMKTTVDAVEEKVKNVIGQEIGEVLGLGGKPNAKANRAAVQEVAEGMTESLAWSKESLDIVGNYQGATKSSFDKVFNSLEKTQQLVLDGRFAQAKRELAKTDNRKAGFQKLFGSTTAGEIQRLKKEMLALIEVGQSTKGHAQPENLLGKIRSMGVPTISAYIANPLVGAGVSTVKGVARFASNKANMKKLADVEKALGGKLKVDAEAERMLAQGSDVGDVVGYLVAKMLRED